MNDFDNFLKKVSSVFFFTILFIDVSNSFSNFVFFSKIKTFYFVLRDYRAVRHLFLHLIPSRRRSNWQKNFYATILPCLVWFCHTSWSRSDKFKKYQWEVKLFPFLKLGGIQCVNKIRVKSKISEPVTPLSPIYFLLWLITLFCTDFTFSEFSITEFLCLKHMSVSRLMLLIRS